MNKLLKKELNHIKSTLYKYKAKIPTNQLSKFEKDLQFIFDEIDNTVDYNTLEDLKRMAKGKLISVQRMYGALDEEINDIKEKEDGKENKDNKEGNKNAFDKDKINNKNEKIKINMNESSSSMQEEQIFEKIGDLTRNMDKEILSKTETEFLKELFLKEGKVFDENEPYKPKYEEFLKADFFNKDIVNRHHDKAEFMAQKMNEAFEEAQRRKKAAQDENDKDKAKGGYKSEKQDNLDNKTEEDKTKIASGEFNVKEYFENGQVDKKGFENHIREVLKKHDVHDIDEHIRDLNLDENVDKLEKELQEQQQKEKENAQKEAILKEKEQNKIFSVTANDLFKEFSEDTGINLTQEEIENIRNKAKKQFPEYSQDELDKIEYFEKWNAENEKAKLQNDGEIILDKYGNFEFNFYKEEEESEPGTSKLYYKIIKKLLCGEMES